MKILNNISIKTDKNGREEQESRFGTLDLVINTSDINQYAGGWVPPHWHHEMELFILYSGEIEMLIGDSTQIFHEGDVCFINSDIIHSYQALRRKSCRFRCIVFDPGIIGGEPGSIFDSNYINPLIRRGPKYLMVSHTDKDDVIHRDIDNLYEICIEQAPGYEFQVRNILSEIIIQIESEITMQDIYRVHDIQAERLKIMLAWIEENISGPINIRGIADSVHVSPRECQRIFSRYLHRTPIGYVREKRIITAAELLDSTEKTVTEIAFQCGFSSPGYFSRQFREIMGCSPAEYRQSRKNDREQSHS